jgi:uncharacterized protein (TIGR02453 family)
VEHTHGVSAFTGFPSDVYDFWEGVEQHNDRDWFQANKARYEHSVKAPMEALLADLGDKLAVSTRVMRIHRDVRFSKDKRPLKDQLGAMADRGAAGVWYVHVDVMGVTLGAGVPGFERDQLARYREAVDDATTGAALAKIVTSLRRRGFEVGTVHGEEMGATDLKRVPSPYAQDHPRAELLKLKGLIAGISHGRPPWLHSPAAVAEIAKVWRSTAPLGDWISAHT